MEGEYLSGTQSARPSAFRLALQLQLSELGTCSTEIDDVPKWELAALVWDPRVQATSDHFPLRPNRGNCG